MSPARELPYEPHVDGLRAWAVAAVVIFHAWPAALPGGFAGVDVFFVISGYLITQWLLCPADANAAQGPCRRLLHFYARRVVRLFPALLAVLVGTLALAWPWMPGSQLQALGAEVAWGAAMAGNVGAWLGSGYFEDAGPARVLLQLWSLGVEEQFYALWPLLLWVALGRPGATVPAWRRALPWALGLLSLALCVFTTANQPSAAYYLLPWRAWELIAGAALAAWKLRAGGRLLTGTVASAATLAGWALLGVSFAALNRTMAFPGAWALLPVSAAVLLIAGAPGAAPALRAALTTRLAVGLGLVSYPLYLWHWPLLTLWRLHGGPGVSNASGAVVVGVSVGLAVLSWAVLEQPLRRAAHRSRSTALKLAAALVAAMALVAAAGLWLGHANPVAARDAAVLQGLGEWRYAHEAPYRSGQCFIEKIEQVDRARNFDAACVDATPSGHDAPLLVIWGDSMAAHLYPGLRQVAAAQSLRLAQFTVASCPPLLNHRSLPLCAELNASTWARIEALRPRWVLLSGLAWTSADREQLAQSVAAIRRLGAEPLVVGTPPQWEEPLLRLAQRRLQREPGAALSTHESAGLSPLTFSREQDLRGMARAVGVPYLSLVDLLCENKPEPPDGPAARCRWRLDSGVDRLLAWDGVHLTDEGSALVAAAILQRLRERPTR